jgi:hypothetical protein
MKERKGWTWKEIGQGGFWVKDSGARHKHRKEFFCPHCRKPTGTIDDDCLQEYGFCKECYVMHVESRQTPTIDLAKYKKNQD